MGRSKKMKLVVALGLLLASQLTLQASADDLEDGIGEASVGTADGELGFDEPAPEHREKMRAEMRERMKARRKEFADRSLRRRESRLEFDKLRAKYRAASSDEEKKKIVAEARALQSRMLDEEKASLQKRVEMQKEQLARVEERLKKFDGLREQRLSRTEELLRGGRPGPRHRR